MLLSTDQELQDLTGIGQGNSIEAYQSDINEATEDFLKPLLGDALYTLLLSQYEAREATPLQEPDLSLLKYSQAIIANMGISKNVDLRQVQISDQGIQKGGESAYYYQKVDLQNYFSKRSYRAMELLLLFLEKNIEAFPLWVNSDAYYLNRSFLIPNAYEFQRHYNIKSSRRTYMAMQPIMRKVENFAVIETIGEAFYNELILTVQNDPGLTNEQKAENKKLLELYLRPAVAYLTIAEAVKELSLTLSPDGLHLTENIASSDKTLAQKQATDQQLEIQSERAADNGNQYLSRLQNYLNQNASGTLFKAYYDSSLYQDPNPTTSQESRRKEDYEAPNKLYGL